MKKILIPTDFSSTSVNDSVYGLHFAQQTNAEKVFLFNAFQAPINVSPDPMVPSIESFDFDTLRKASSDSLSIFKQNITNKVPTNVSVEIISECCTLVSDIDSISKENEVGLIIMGITGSGTMSEVFVGSNSIQVSKHTDVPVLIIPPNIEYKPVTNILLVSDYINVKETIPYKEICKLLDATKAKLTVLHVDEEYLEEEPENDIEQKEILSSMFKDYTVEYFIATNSIFLDAVNKFIEMNNIDLVIAVPKKHGFPENILHHSVSKTMAFHSHIPIVLIKNTPVK